MKKSIIAILTLYVFFLPGTIVKSQTPKDPDQFHTYNLPHTEVRELTSEITKVKYILYISLPKAYAEETYDYPTVYTLDADYSFALAHNIIEHFSDRNDLPPMVIVGIAYEGASQDMHRYRWNRVRDYTPVKSSMYLPEYAGYADIASKISGGGKKFQSFIIQELIPYIEENYRVKKDDRTIVGHSMGGLFGAYMLFTMPEIFQKYILVSPSLWYEGYFIFDIEQSYFSSHDTLNANVFISIGGCEPIRFMGYHEFVQQLQSRAYKNLKLNSYIFDKETHNSIFPAALSRGLRIVSINTEN